MPCTPRGRGLVAGCSRGFGRGGGDRRGALEGLQGWCLGRRPIVVGRPTCSCVGRRENAVNVPDLIVSELLDPGSGRVDAARLGTFLGISVEDVAALVRRPVESVAADTSAPGLQERLGLAMFIVGGLLELLGGDHEMALIWLNAPHPVLDDEMPLHLMFNDELEVVVALIDDILSGAPA